MLNGWKVVDTVHRQDPPGRDDLTILISSPKSEGWLAAREKGRVVYRGRFE